MTWISERGQRMTRSVILTSTVCVFFFPHIQERMTWISERGQRMTWSVILTFTVCVFFPHIQERMTPVNAHEDYAEPYECRWARCDRRFQGLEELVAHVNERHVKIERPDVEYQCRWAGCPRRGRGFNARSVPGLVQNACTSLGSIHF